MKQALAAAFVLIVCLLGLLAAPLLDDQEVFLESRESKTVGGGPVFNRIKWFNSKDKDVWMMNQSHHGPHAEATAWDRLAIVVDKTKTPKVARFYQLKPGPLEWDENAIESSTRPFRISCFLCHNNGPRAIRPNERSSFGPLSLTDRWKITYWNLRIKLYGRVKPDQVHDQLDRSAQTPFRFHGSFANEPLRVAVCLTCHNESGFLARGLLRRQQMATIKFMVESGEMPPRGFGLSGEEKRELARFLDGF